MLRGHSGSQGHALDEAVVEGCRVQNGCGQTGCKAKRNWKCLDAGGGRDPANPQAPVGQGVDG